MSKVVDWDEIAKRLTPPSEFRGSRAWRRRVNFGSALTNWHRIHQHNLCAYCGLELILRGKAPWYTRPSLDHIDPLSKGGLHTVENTCVSCKGCNVCKADMGWEEFMDTIDVRSGQAMAEGRYMKLKKLKKLTESQTGNTSGTCLASTS